MKNDTKEKSDFVYSIYVTENLDPPPEDKNKKRMVRLPFSTAIFCVSFPPLLMLLSIVNFCSVPSTSVAFVAIGAFFHWNYRRLFIIGDIVFFDHE